MKPSRTQSDVLHDMADGRTLEYRCGDWGGMLCPGELPGKRRRTPLARVKTVTIDALDRRGWIEQDAGVSFDDYYRKGKAKVHRITDLGLRVIGRFDDKRGL